MSTPSLPTGLKTLKTDVHPSTGTPPAKTSAQPDLVQGQRADAQEDDDSQTLGFSSWSSAYRTQLGGDGAADKTPRFVRPTDEELQRRYAGVTPEHVVSTDPVTGFVHERWTVKVRGDANEQFTYHGHDEKGKFTSFDYNPNGPASKVTDPKTGVIVSERYYGTHGPGGRESIERDPNTGVATEENIVEKDGSKVLIQRDATSGVVTYQDRLDKDGKLVDCVQRDANGSDTVIKGKNRDGQTVGAPKEMAPGQKPQTFGTKMSAPAIGAKQPSFMP